MRPDCAAAASTNASTAVSSNASTIAVSCAPAACVDVVRHDLERCLRTPREVHRCAFTRERARHRAADVSAAAVDHRDFAVEFHDERLLVPEDCQGDRKSSLFRRFADERVEQALIGLVVGSEVLGMPLHREDERAIEFERFDDAVGGAPDNTQSVAELVDGLMVVARRHHAWCP